MNQDKNSNPLAANIENDFVVINANKQASIEPADVELYQRLDAHYQQFAGCELVSCHESREDWSSWEMHPTGDELVMLLAGSATMVWQTASGQQSAMLAKQGDFIVIPKGAWHTANIAEYAKLLFVTPGQGTQHKAR